MSSTATDIRSAVCARTDPAQPYVTYLGSDGRMELSGASVINAAAKIANALTSECRRDAWLFLRAAQIAICSSQGRSKLRISRAT